MEGQLYQNLMFVELVTDGTNTNNAMESLYGVYVLL